MGQCFRTGNFSIIYNATIHHKLSSYSNSNYRRVTIRLKNTNIQIILKPSIASSETIEMWQKCIEKVLAKCRENVLEKNQSSLDLAKYHLSICTFRSCSSMARSGTQFLFGHLVLDTKVLLALFDRFSEYSLHKRRYHSTAGHQFDWIPLNKKFFNQYVAKLLNLNQSNNTATHPPDECFQVNDSCFRKTVI